MAERRLNIIPQSQKDELWCWAAIASMLSHAYNHPLGQCQIASFYLYNNTINCCSNPGRCRSMAELNLVLKKLEYQINEGYIIGRISFEYLKNEINSNKPVAIRVVNDEDYGHYVLLIGYVETGADQKITYIDSRYGSVRTVNYGSIARSVMETGRWSHTYCMSHGISTALMI